MAKRSTKHRVQYTIKGEVITDDLIGTLADLDAIVGTLPGDVELQAPTCKPISDAKAAALLNQQAESAEPEQPADAVLAGDPEAEA